MLLLLLLSVQGVRLESSSCSLLSSKTGRRFLELQELEEDWRRDFEDELEEQERSSVGSMEEAIQKAVNATWSYKQYLVKSKEPWRQSKFPLPRWDYEGECEAHLELWDCLGSDRSWGVVFVDLMPLSLRAEVVRRMLPRSHLVVLHDSQANYLGYPADYVSHRSRWEGRKSKTHIAVGDAGEDVLTTIIQGDLDLQAKYAHMYWYSLTTFLRESHQEFEDLARLANPRSSAEGSHVKFLAAAVLLTVGDVLELGTGLASTELIHSLVEAEFKELNALREAGEVREQHRAVVSVDSDSDWIARFHEFSKPWHQFVLLPVYSHGTACSQEAGPATPQNSTSSLAVNVNFAVREATNAMAGELTCDDLA